MARTRFEGKNLVVKVENASAAEVALTFATAATIDFGHQDVVFNGDNVQASQAGQLVASVEVEYEVDTTATTGNQAVLSGILGDNVNPRFVRVQPAGSTAGELEFAMDAVLLSYGPTGVNRENKVMGKAMFKNHTEASADPNYGTVSA